MFDETIASCRVGLAKPQQQIYQLALSQLGVTAQESVFIDDKQVNIKAAAEMGFTTILGQNPTQIIKDVHKIIN